jgi:TonB family protein
MMFVTVRRRSFLAVASLVALAATSSRTFAQTFVELPVDPPDPLEQTAKPITIENPLPSRLLGGAPMYPGEAMGTGAAGAMVFRLTIDNTGTVAKARYIGHDRYALRDVRGHLEAAPMLDQQFIAASQDALRGWLYEPPVAAPILIDVEFVFSGDGRTRVVRQEPARPVACGEEVVEWITITAPTHPEVPAVGGTIAAPRRIKDVSPVYPAEAFAQCIEGAVIVNILIDETGHVADARSIRYNPLLEKAALDAVRQWEFAPTLVDGHPTAVTMPVTITFTRQR